MVARIILGDCRDTLRTLADESIDCCVTSPPYYGLRSYLPPGHEDKRLEIGSEPTLAEWVQTLVEVFREVRRVLRPRGVLMLNVGDAYAGSRRGGDSGSSTLNCVGKGRDSSKDAYQQMVASRRRDNALIPRSDIVVDGLKPKDMMGQPWRLAFALQDDGWWLRQEIIWHKPNPMPESARDRCTKAHEHVFLLSKSQNYFWNFEATQEPAGDNTHARKSLKAPDGWDTTKGAGGHGSVHKRGLDAGKTIARPQTGASYRMGREPGWRVKNNESFATATATVTETRNPRSVWTIPTKGFKGAHFATFPPELARRMLLAACPPGGTALDPFGGAGTVGMVAHRLGMHSVLCELDIRSVMMAEERIVTDPQSPPFSVVELA